MNVYVISILVALAVSCSALPQFNVTKAFEIYHYAQPAYCNSSFLPLWECEPCKLTPNMQELQVFFNNSHDAQGYCGYDADKKNIIVAIRGTVDFNNWKADFDFPLTSYQCNGCKVHEGFHKIWEDLANNLLACAYTLHSNHPEAPIIVTGHSLGAAQSVFAALEINQYVGKVDEFYNFGCPRVGNSAFADYVESQLSHLYPARIVHWKDIFTHLPLQSMGFQHYGHEIFLNEENTNYQVCNREDDNCQDQFFWPWEWNIKDHLYYYGVCSGCSQAACAKY